MNDQEIMTMNEAEDMTTTADDNAVICDECESDSVLGTIVKVGVGIGVGIVASKVIAAAKPKFRALKEKHEERKAAKKAAKEAKAEDSDHEEIEEE